MFADFDRYLKDHNFVLTEKEFEYVCKNTWIVVKLNKIRDEYYYYTAIAGNGKTWSFLVEKKVEDAA